jgi:hypothetical protein
MFLDSLLSTFCLLELDKGKRGTFVEVIDTFYLSVDFKVFGDLFLFKVLRETANEYLPNLKSSSKKLLQDVRFSCRKVH